MGACLGKTFGNNGADGHEGARVNNLIGTYLHGPLLPKNPQVADWLLATALDRMGGGAVDLAPLDDAMEVEANLVMRRRLL